MSLEADVELKTSAVKFLEIFSTRIYELLTISPEIIQSIEIVEGEWGTVVKEEVESISITELSITFKVIEGDLLELSITFKVIEGDLLEIYNSFRFILKLTPNALSGSVLHLTLEYAKPSEDTPDPTSLLEAVIQVSKDVDVYVTNLI